MALADSVAAPAIESVVEAHAGLELLEIGAWGKAKETGKLRVEGKDYVVREGDVLLIRFSV